MNEENKAKLKEVIKDLNLSLKLYYDNVPAITAQDTIMISNKPHTGYQLLQFFQGKMDDMREACETLLKILRDEEK